MITLIENTPIAYEWGSNTAIAEMLGHIPSGSPEAELWLGAHPASPARIVGGGATLSEVVPDLPFLLKVLAAEAPLSIQGHPGPRQALEGFGREVLRQTPPGERNYRDQFPKPEMILALSDPLRALCGFRPVTDVRDDLSPWSEVPGIALLLDALHSDRDLPAVISWLLTSTAASVVVSGIIECAHRANGTMWETVRYLARHRPADPGIAVSVLLNTVELRPGEVLDVPAGRIHAYLHGAGIELMGPSDNVLRGGLTSKRIDVAELVSVLDFTPGEPRRIQPRVTEPGINRYESDDGSLVLIEIKGIKAKIPIPRFAIALSLGGPSRIGNIEVPAGGAALITDASRVDVSVSKRLFVAHGAHSGEQQ